VDEVHHITAKSDAPAPVFAVGTGRCGTHFLQRIMAEGTEFSSLHMPLPESDSFHRYCMWNGLPVDHGVLLATRSAWIEKAHSQRQRYFEANPYLSFSALLLHKQLGGRVILITRDPEPVVNSHLVKGWYSQEYIRHCDALAPGLQPEMSINHSFGRIIPRGDEYRRWLSLTRVGKLSWMWNAVNVSTRSELALLPSDCQRSVRLEDLNYSKYLALHRFCGGMHPMEEARYRAICEERPGKAKSHVTCENWSTQERCEFEHETAQGRKLLGY
jgi:hypothetical protein